MTTTGSIKIHSENLLPIIKRWLYADRDIFIRELVSNSCDAISKLKILRDRKEADALDTEFRIDITLDQEKKTLCVSDTGIGMSKKEIETYIAQLAFSGAEEFLKNYQSDEEKDQMIGHFGLGFYSVYMVADLVEIDSKSFKKEEGAAYWRCDGSTEYTMDEGKREERGTKILLHINKDNEDFLDPSKLRELLEKYCSFLPYPIYLNGSRINEQEPLWNKPASECKDQDYIDFYHKLYPMQGDPLFWIHLNVDFPFHLKGILFFPKITQQFHNSKDSIHLYCNRVFVADNCKDLIPDFLTMLRGVIDSPDIPLNVSRSQLQMDRTVRQLAGHISKKVSDRLSSLYKTDRESFIKNWEDVGTVIKIGAIEDRKFYSRVKDFLIWKNDKNEWTTTEEYLERHKESSEGKIYYSADEHSPYLKMYQGKNIEVLFLPSPLDTALMSTVEQELSDVKFQRIDGGLEDKLIDKEREQTLLDAEGKTKAGRLADFFRKELNDVPQLEVEAKSLPTDELPAMLVLEEHARRLRDHMALSSQGGGAENFSFPVSQKLVLNTNNSFVQSLPSLSEQDPALAKELVHHLYQLVRLSQREMEAKDLSLFISQAQDVLSKLTEKSLKQKES